MQQDRRQFFQSLIAGGAAARKTRKHVAHTDDVRIYHGPMQVPLYVVEAISADPTPHRATGRGTHLVSRYAEPDATVWVFRCQFPVHRGMVGEIVRTPLGRIRVHCWASAQPSDRYETPLKIIERMARRDAPHYNPCDEIIERKAAPVARPAYVPVMPPVGWPSTWGMSHE